MAVNDQELRALLSLLDTESGSSASLLLTQIRAFPEARVERLLGLAAAGSAAESCLNQVLAEHDAPHLHAELTRWLVEGADLERGVLLVARTGYSRLDEAAVCGELDRLAAEIRPGL